MTLDELKTLVETNAINLHGRVTIVGDCVSFQIKEMGVFDVRAYVQGDAILDVCDGGFDTVYESGEAYARFLRCEDEDSIK